MLRLRGSFFARVDSDDLWHPSKLSRQVALASDDPGLALIYTWVRYVDGESRVLSDGPPQRFPQFALCRGIVESLVGGGSSLLMRTSAVTEVGGFDERFRGWEDLLLQLEISANHRIGFVPEYLVGYRVSSGSLSSGEKKMLADWRAARSEIRRRFPGVPPFVDRWAHASRCMHFAEAFAWRGKFGTSSALLAEALATDPRGTGHWLAHRLRRRLTGERARHKPGPPFASLDPGKSSVAAAPRDAGRLRELTTRRVDILERVDERLARLRGAAHHAAEPAPFVSIIVPFHNSAETCGSLLETLSKLGPGDGAEIILVDDGSTDGTRERLRAFAETSRARVTVIEQERRGPGGARNAGLDRATGTFVWFVDSDDDIDLGALDAARELRRLDVDLIAWEWKHPTIRRPMLCGLHQRSGKAIPHPFDPIVANWYSTEFLRRAQIRFPEFCIYEATPLEAFVLPLAVSTYYKSDFSAYRANLDTPSVTRGYNPAYYDRLATVAAGMEVMDQAALPPDVRRQFEEDFVELFLWFSIRISRLPDASWLRAMRVMRHYRDEAARLHISVDPFAVYPGRSASKAVLRMLWAASAALPSQGDYFAQLHMRNWGSEMAWARPRIGSSA